MQYGERAKEMLRSSQPPLQQDCWRIMMNNQINTQQVGMVGSSCMVTSYDVMIPTHDTLIDQRQRLLHLQRQCIKLIGFEKS